MTIENNGNITILTADEGKLLTNGNIASTTVYLGKNDSAANWTEVDEYAEDAVADPKRVDSLEAENKKLSAKLEAAIEANANLEECIIEMAEIIYA